MLLYWLGLQLAERLPRRLLALTPWLALAGVSAGGDPAGLARAAAVAAFPGLSALGAGAAPLLDDVPAVLAMELWGTWLGNWTWRSSLPGLGLAGMQSASGGRAFYCVSDVLSEFCVAAGLACGPSLGLESVAGPFSYTSEGFSPDPG